MKNKLSRFWNDLPLFWKTYALMMVFATSVVMIGEGAEGLAKTLIRLADLQIKSNVREVLLWLLAIMVSSLLGSWIISRIITGTLTRIQPVVERLAGGDLASRVDAAEADRGDEIGGLSRSFNQMADNVARLLENEHTLIRDISHEMRSPLTRMKMALSLLKRDSISSEPVEPHIAQLEKDIDRLEVMVGQMLEQARLETMAQSGVIKKEFDLAALVQESLEEQAAGAPGKNIGFEGLKSAAYVGNAVLMRRAVDNLIKNALSYTAPGTMVTVRLRSVTDALILEVMDQGPGVPEDKLDEIFRPFYRVDSARARKSGGFGLGLAIARQAAQLHGGQVTAINISAKQKSSNVSGARNFADDLETGLKVTLTLPTSPEICSTTDGQE